MRSFWRWSIRGVIVLACVAGLLSIPFTSPAHASACGSPCYFTYQATTSNTNGYIMTIGNDNAYLTQVNAAPWLLLQVMQDYAGSYDAHPFGVWYSPFAKKWTIFNEDKSPIPLGSAFMVSVTPASTQWNGTTWDYLQVTATANNTSGDFVRIDDPVTNNNPAALVFITQAYTGTYDTSQVGAYFDTLSQKWTVFNEDMTPIPIGTTFNLELESGPGTVSQVVQATSSNTHGYITYIGTSFSPLQITPVYNPNGVCGCFFNNHPIGFWYDTSLFGGPTIYNVDRSPMPPGAAFFVTG